MAKKITEESLRLNIIVNGDQGRKAILDMENAVKSNNATLAKLKTNLASMEAQGKTTGKAYDSLKKQVEKETAALETNRQKLEALKRQQSVNTMTMAELRKHINLTRTALVNAVPGTENWARLNNELQESKTRLKQLEVQSQATDKTVCSLAGRFRDYYISVKGGLDIVRQVGRYVTQATDAYQEYDEAITDAMKTTNLSKEEVAALGEEFKKMDTRTAQNELMALLRIGGKLGISGQEDLLGFVRAADKINVALSEDLGGNAEDAIAAIGKMTDIFDLASVYGQEEAMLKIASAVNSLGMASTANEGYIVDFTKRMAGIAPNADISIDKILGLAATLDKYGQTSEVSATSIGQTIVAMYKKTETFANIAKMSFGEFKQLLDTDVNEALLRVAEGMKGATDGGFAPIVEAMDGMGLNGQRAVTVLGTLAKNSEEVRSQQVLANQAFSDGSSVIEEFNTKNESATAQMEKAKNSIHNQVVEIGQKLMPVVQGVMDIADVGMGVLSKLVGLLISMKTVIIALTAAYAALRVAKLADVAVDKLRHFFSVQNRADLALEATLLAGSSKRTIALSAAKNLLAGNLKAAGTAFKVFATSLKTGLGPVGWVVIAVEALLALFAPLMKIWGDQRKLNKQLEESNRELSASYNAVSLEIDKEKSRLSRMEATVLKAKTGSTERAAAIRQINSAYGEYLPKLLTEKSSNEEVATALAGVNAQLERKIRLQAKEKALTEVNESVDNQTKEVMAGFIDMLEKSTGESTTAAMRSQMNAAVIEYRTAIEAATTEAQKKAARSNLFSTYFELGGNQMFFRGDKLRGLAKGLDIVIESGKRATETLDQLYGTADGTGSVMATATTASTTTTGNGGGDGGSGNGGSSGSRWSLNNDEAYLEAVLALKKKYASGEIETEKDLNDQILQLEIDSLRERLKIAEGDEILAVDSQLQDKLIQQKNARIRAEEAAALEHVKTDAELQLEQLNEREARANAAHELSMLELQNRHNEELAAAKANGDDLNALKERQAQELAGADMEYIREISDILRDLTGDDVIIEIDVGGSADEQLTALKTKIQELIAMKNRLEGKEQVNYSSGDRSRGSGGGADQEDAGDKWDGFGGSDLFGVNTRDLESLVQSMKDGKLAADEWATAIKGIGGMADYAMDIASQWAQNQTKLEQKQLKEYEKANDRKKRALERRLDAGLISEAQYNAESEKLDAAKEAYQEEIALRQAKRQKQLNLIQAIINTALSVSMALATNPFPLSLVVAGINAAMGAAQIALIAAQPVTTGYEKGGYTEVKRSQDGKVFKARLSPERGLINEPTVLVGESGREYVIPNEGVSNPSLAPFLGTIETARRNGTLKDLDFGAVYSPLFTAAGRAAGGSTADGISLSVPEAGDRQIVVTLDDETRSLLKEIREKQNDPTPAVVSMLGKNGLVETYRKYENQRKKGQL